MASRATLDQLVIDRDARAVRPSEDSVGDWGAEQAVFVSSVIDGYGKMRDAAADAIEAIGARPVLFERFGGRDADPNAAS